MWKIKRDNEHQKSKIAMLSIDKISYGKYQPRFGIDEKELEDLINSIREVGVLQPVLVRRSENGYELVAGERRLRASKSAGLLEIPAIIKDIDEREAKEIALIENLQRKDLHFFEEAEGFHYLINNYRLTQQMVAERVGLSQSAVANKLRLLNLSAAIRQKIVELNLSERHARALLEIEEEDTQMALLRSAEKREFSVAEWERLIKSEIMKNISQEINNNRKKRIKPMIKDVRLFINSLERGVETMRSSGLNVTMKRERFDRKVRIIIEVDENR